ncbi:MAG: nitroreductase, partial [Planctomycetota bacterium]
NLLLMLTAHGMGTYWSSGGKLREPETMRRLGIADNERLLAAVFVEYPGADPASHDRKPGGLRNTRSDGWIREASL